ncbi:M1 family metallopeptidase [Cytophagales bacterium LB-30]|uniref:M1 family metallopeptidase n=1 Tax=Shiella aurantiaca TaxID=3058365 RepID=A0ABT8F8F8_9BACT|nr:M1 family metallopeptidase [Shiella aurantiaca]MDN4166765.1 M1 family metallopeptidase [Shiella aurantiaca]
MRKIFLLAGALLATVAVKAQDRNHAYKFEQMGTLLPTPNVYRTASGAPGHMYWQQQVDYVIDVELDESIHRINGKEKITYTNNSPDQLTYLWVQLDQNMRAEDSDTYKTETGSMEDKMTKRSLTPILGYGFDGGHKIQSVTDASGKAMKYVINKTMMRVDLEKPIKSGEKFEFNISWYYNINDRLLMGGRGGYETFPEDGNTLYTITQWFPRLAVYSDSDGWQHKQFLGRGEFALPFGNYLVRITVPSDHIVASTGELQNAEEVLTAKQRELFEKAKTATRPVIIVTQKEAEQKEKTKAKDKKTWIYKADNVRDFAFGSSRKYIWDAMGVKIGDRTVMAMSYYPKEANPLYETYSTEAVAHTLRVYSKHTIDYPYPVAISVEASNGMEYPMICFNYGRPEKDGTYSEAIKYGMISVIIHEVGHNFFPMIVNSDERQWTWMDEGLNSFMQFLAEQEWDKNYPSRRGPAANMVSYMKSSKDTQEPIMTNSEQIIQFGNNAYGKPATALNILRETVMGRELFDYAFKEYARRWAFKHPNPADLFRTMEDASGVDLDWFWKGWFYTTENVDISIDDMKWYVFDSKNPEVENPRMAKEKADAKRHVSQTINEKTAPKSAVESRAELRDFYNSYNEFEVTAESKAAYKKYLESLDAEEKAMLNSGYNFYELSFSNKGGLVMPVILNFTFKDGSKEMVRIPAEVWRMNEKEFTKVFPFKKEVVSVELDPQRETADVDTENNYWPRQMLPSRFELYKYERRPSSNPMQKKK